MASRIKSRFINWGTGSDQVNSQALPANFSPSHYTPTQVGTEGNDKVSAHLHGIDIELGAQGSQVVHGATVYVSQHGGNDTTGTGSFAQPFASVTAANSFITTNLSPTLSNIITIQIDTGFYSEQPGFTFLDFCNYIMLGGASAGGVYINGYYFLLQNPLVSGVTIGDVYQDYNGDLFTVLFSESSGAVAIQTSGPSMPASPEGWVISISPLTSGVTSGDIYQDPSSNSFTVLFSASSGATSITVTGSNAPNPSSGTLTFISGNGGDDATITYSSYVNVGVLTFVSGNGGDDQTLVYSISKNFLPITVTPGANSQIQVVGLTTANDISTSAGSDFIYNDNNVGTFQVIGFYQGGVIGTCTANSADGAITELFFQNGGVLYDPAGTGLVVNGVKQGFYFYSSACYSPIVINQSGTSNASGVYFYEGSQLYAPVTLNSSGGRACFFTALNSALTAGTNIAINATTVSGSHYTAVTLKGCDNDPGNTVVVSGNHAVLDVDAISMPALANITFTGGALIGSNFQNDTTTDLVWNASTVPGLSTTDALNHNAHPTVYYIDADVGNDSTGTGTYQNPFATINAAQTARLVADPTQSKPFFFEISGQVQEVSTGTASLVVQDLTYAAVTAGAPGIAISIAYTTGGTAGSEVVSVSGNAISVQIAAGVSTATQIQTAVQASAPATALATVSVSGTGSNAQNAPSMAQLIGAGFTFLNVNLMTISGRGDSMSNWGVDDGGPIQFVYDGSWSAGYFDLEFQNISLFSNGTHTNSALIFDYTANNPYMVVELNNVVANTLTTLGGGAGQLEIANNCSFTGLVTVSQAGSVNIFNSTFNQGINVSNIGAGNGITWIYNSHISNQLGVHSTRVDVFGGLIDCNSQGSNVVTVDDTGFSGSSGWGGDSVLRCRGTTFLNDPGMTVAGATGPVTLQLTSCDPEGSTITSSDANSTIQLDGVSASGATLALSGGAVLQLTEVASSIANDSSVAGTSIKDALNNVLPLAGGTMTGSPIVQAHSAFGVGSTLDSNSIYPSASMVMSIYEDFTNPTGNKGHGINCLVTANPTTANTMRLIGGVFTAQDDASSTNAPLHISALGAQAFHEANTTVPLMIGFAAQAEIDNGIVTDGRSIYSQFYHEGTATLPNAYGLYQIMFNDAGGTITEADLVFLTFGNDNGSSTTAATNINIQTPSNDNGTGSTIGTMTGILIADQGVTGITTAYNINSDASVANFNIRATGTSPNYFQAKTTFAGGILNTAAQTTLTGSAGTAVCSQPEQGSSYKKVVIYLNGYTDAGTQTYTFPVAFTNTPYVYGLTAGVAGATASTSSVTFTVTTQTGFVFLEGY